MMEKRFFLFRSLFLVDIMTESIAPPDTGVFADHERPKRIFKIIVIGDSHVGMMLDWRMNREMNIALLF